MCSSDLVLPMGVEAVAALYAAARIGAIVVPIFSGFSAPAIAARFADCAVAAVITADTTTRRGREVPVRATVDEALALAPVAHVITVGRDAVPPGDCPVVSCDAEAPVLIGYTSGTTGRPKGAVHTHGGLLSKLALEGRLVMDLRPDDRVLWVTDMGWIMGPWVTIGAHARGATLVCFDGAPDWQIGRAHV